MSKPLFIPLYTQYFEQFKAGTKAPGLKVGIGPPIKYQTEFRPYGPRWNEHTCVVGREVVLSHGYGKKNRLRGVVVGFEVSFLPTKTEAWEAIYGDKHDQAACIQIHVYKEQV